MKTQLPLPKKGAEPLPQFSADVYCGQTAGWTKMALAMEVGLGPGRAHCARWGRSSPPQKRAEPTNFRPVYSGQMAGWIKMSLGMEIGFGTGDIVLDGDPPSSPQRHSLPNSRPMFIIGRTVLQTVAQKSPNICHLCIIAQLCRAISRN